MGELEYGAWYGASRIRHHRTPPGLWYQRQLGFSIPRGDAFFLGANPGRAVVGGTAGPMKSKLSTVSTHETGTGNGPCVVLSWGIELVKTENR